VVRGGYALKQQSFPSPMASLETLPTITSAFEGIVNKSYAQSEPCC